MYAHHPHGTPLLLLRPLHARRHRPESSAADASPRQYQFPSQPAVVPPAARRPLQDPVIYPGLYSATGYDLMSILVSPRPSHASPPFVASRAPVTAARASDTERQLRIMSRPNPQIELGAVDCSVALVLCNLDHPDHPIVYASRSFCELTGYSMPEVIGRNCRFLQTPGGSHPSKAAVATDQSDVRRMRKAIHSHQEIQLRLTNFKKNGQPFRNIVSIVPLDLDSSGVRYAVGFQVEVD